jgi:cyclopropane-fatty-acyl-phospholipid synthase
MSTLAASTYDDSVALCCDFLDQITACLMRRDFAVRFWDGSTWCNTRHPHFTFVLRHPGALRTLFQSSDELALGEAYIYDDFDVEGDLEAACAFGSELLEHELRLADKLRLASLLHRLPEDGRPHLVTREVPKLYGWLHSKRRDRRAVTYHYNLSNDFYSLWLDRNMTYSCAYFRSGAEDIDQAQIQKLDYICRKLRLRAGERLLDVGCGWGGLILHAASRFGVRALGITLSEPQAEWAHSRIQEAGLTDRCEVQLRDYRDLATSPAFDKVVSVGMFEHVGKSLLPEYFSSVGRLLRAGGVFLNHGIAASETCRRRGPSFVDKYVFPDGDLVPLNVAIGVAEACGFEVRDVESLREHYARTLRHWVQRLESSYKDAKQLTNETVYRIWRLYMSGCAHGFASGRVNVYQVLLSKPDHGDSHLPLTRSDWYA